MVVDFLGGPPPPCGVWCNGRLVLGTGLHFAPSSYPCAIAGSQLRPHPDGIIVIQIGLDHAVHGKFVPSSHNRRPSSTSPCI